MYVHHKKIYQSSLLELHIRLVRTFITQKITAWFTESELSHFAVLKFFVDG